MRISLHTSGFRRYTGLRHGRMLVFAALVVVLGMFFAYVRLPSGWLIAGLIAAAAVAMASRRELNPPARAMALAQGVIGLVAAEPLTRLKTTDLAHFAGCAAVSIGLTLVVSILLGLALHGVARQLDLPTAGLSLIAGGASSIACMARELGADQRYVALSQYLRLTVVLISMPFIVKGLGATGSGAPTGMAQNAWSVPGLLAAALLIVVGSRLARLAHVPAPHLLGPLLLVAGAAVIAPSWVTLMNPPALVTGAAYVLVGWQAGGGFAVDTLRRFVRLVPVIAVFIALTIASCFGIAAVVSEWTGVRMADAYLATTPGIYGVLAIADSVHAGPIVVTLQVLRYVTIVAAAGLIPKVLGLLHKCRVRDVQGLAGSAA